MDNEFDDLFDTRALDQSLAIEASYEKGWNDAVKWYQGAFDSFFETFKISLPTGQKCLMITKQDIEDMFKEVPEDEMTILRSAALSRGQP